MDLAYIRVAFSVSNHRTQRKSSISRVTCLLKLFSLRFWKTRAKIAIKNLTILRKMRYMLLFLSNFLRSYYSSNVTSSNNPCPRAVIVMNIYDSGHYHNFKWLKMQREPVFCNAFFFSKMYVFFKVKFIKYKKIYEIFSRNLLDFSFFDCIPFFLVLQSMDDFGCYLKFNTF